MTEIKQELDKYTLELSGIEVGIKKWITGAERQHINSAFMEGLQIDPQGGAKMAGDFSVLNKKADVRKFEAFIATFDGRDDMNAEELYQAVMNLPEPDLAVIEEDIKKKSPISDTDVTNP